MNRQFQSLLILTVFLAGTASSCAQEKPKLMVAGQSVRELVPASANPSEDGISRIIFAELFKEGETKYAHVGASGLRKAPPLPTGYTLYKDRVYEVSTQAIANWSFNITVFNLPSVTRESDFKRLAVLHLEDDEMSAGGESWSDVTLPVPPPDDSIYLYFPKSKYDSLGADFEAKRLAGVSDIFGIFAIALAPVSNPERPNAFPEVTVSATSSPEPIQAGQQVSHSIVLTNKSAVPAAEVNVKQVLDINLDYVSSTPSQGMCTQKLAENIIVCHLGALPAGASATITLVSRARDQLIRDDPVIQVTVPVRVIFKRLATDFVEPRGEVFTKLTTTIRRKR